MLEYILNTTIIWLFGLIIFDLFLRREPHHIYNRVYILSILLTGLFIPLWSWDSNTVVYGNGITEPLLEQSTVIKQGITNAGSNLLLSWEGWLWYIYIAGAAFACGRLLVDIYKILRLINAGNKQQLEGHMLISINEPVSPFSLFGYIFIHNASAYNQEELQMIIAHEQRHGRLLHSIDIILVKLILILFWFHPLVYVFEKRLLLVHEYQADEIAKNNVQVYGKFLVEQSVLGTAPVLSHSFIRSPLKKRILMLTKKTTKFAKGKQLFVLPIIMIALVCCTQTAFSDDAPKRDGNKVTYKGNVIEFSEKLPDDTLWIQNPSTGDIEITVTRVEPAPTKLNGDRIYYESELNFQNDNGTYTDVSSLNEHFFKRYILKGLEKELKLLEDGKYYIGVRNIVINANGEIVYFEYDPILKKPTTKNINDLLNSAISDDLQKKFEKMVSKLMNSMPKQEPATIKGKRVPSLYQGYMEKFAVKDGKLDT